MLTLYQFEGSPYCWKVRIALAEKGLQYNSIIPKDRQSDPVFRKLTPIGKVPVLVLEDGTPIFESTVVNEFLQERYPEPPLLPNDPADRARARMIEEVADAYLAPALRVMFAARYRFDAGATIRLARPDESKEAEGLAAAARYLDFLDREIEGQDWFVNQFSLGDIGVTPCLLRSGRLLKLPLGERWPNLASWAERAAARPSIASTAPPPYRIIDESV